MFNTPLEVLRSCVQKWKTVCPRSCREIYQSSSVYILYIAFERIASLRVNNSCDYVIFTVRGYLRPRSFAARFKLQTPRDFAYQAFPLSACNIESGCGLGTRLTVTTLQPCGVRVGSYLLDYHPLPACL